jgi:hypothetical protein
MAAPPLPKLCSVSFYLTPPCFLLGLDPFAPLALCACSCLLS